MINYADISSAYLFVSDLDVVVFSAQSTMTLVITDAGGATVISCSYTPVDGVVKVYDLDQLLSPLIGEVMADFTFSVNSISSVLHILQSNIRVGDGADAFLAGHFLSSVQAARDTAVGRKEMVTLLSTSGTVDVTATCVYADGEMCVPQSVTLASSLPSGIVHEVDCSPSLLVNDSLGVLVQYTVSSGGRKMTFRVSPTQTHRLALLMRNSFGAWEPCYFQGMNEHDPKITRDMAIVNTQLRPLRIDEEDICKSYTGPLRPGAVQLFRDLARSRDVVLLEDGVASDPVVVTDADVKHTDDDGSLPAFTFTWRRASRTGLMMNASRVPRIFDETFDESFN